MDAWESEFTKAVLRLGPAFLAVLDGLSPETSMRRLPIKCCSRDQFLAYRVIYSNDRYFTIRDIIDHCANVLGGVHLGEPKTDTQKGLSELEFLEIGGGHVSIRQLVPILRIVRNALRPLKERVCR